MKRLITDNWQENQPPVAADMTYEQELVHRMGNRVLLTHKEIRYLQEELG